MSNAHDYLAKADEFAGLVRKATSLKDIRKFLECAQSFKARRKRAMVGGK